MSLLPSQIAVADRHYQRPARALPGESCPSWVTRGAHFIVVVSRVRDGDELARDNPDEFVTLLPETETVSATFEAAGATLRAEPDSLVVVPPGPSRLRVHGEGLLVRVFSTDAADLLALADNAAAYAVPNPTVAPLVAWPDPPAGFRLRHYRLAEYVKGDSNMRVFRTTKLMINPLLKRPVPRDVRKLSPHTHADFEQGSLALSGTYVHHLRYPWGPDMTQWREDEHVEMASPSLLVVPPLVVHTSRNIGDAPGYLVDIFAPPRVDFSRKGVVCNADDYPMPAALAA
jgi:mannose-6-phosphate isomerase-like protein (cupin superfamily)